MKRTWLSHPLTLGLDIDDPRITHLHWEIIRKKGFLRRIYQEWYLAISGALPLGDGPVLEIGSGAGFLSDFIPDLITSELSFSPGIKTVIDGRELPFGDRVLRGIVMTNVLHHIPNPRQFFAEAVRCVRGGGVVVMIEPWVSPWSRVVYTRLHHEPFLTEAAQWDFPQCGPLSGANGALPWIIFERDRKQFEREFPMLLIRVIKPMMPFRYIVSGGISSRGLMPECTYSLWSGLEKALNPLICYLSMFAQIELQRTNERQ